MEKLSPLKIIRFAAIFVVAVFGLAVIFLNQIKSEIMHLIGIYGYVAIFFITLIVESLAQPIGPEIPLLSGKLLGLNMFYAAIITIMGSTLASFVNFKIGQIFEQRVNKSEKYAKFVKWYKEHGKYGLLIAALGPVPYVPFCWFSGAFGLSIKRFLSFGLFPRIIRIIFVAYVLQVIF